MLGRGNPDDFRKGMSEAAASLYLFHGAFLAEKRPMSGRLSKSRVLC